MYLSPTLCTSNANSYLAYALNAFRDMSRKVNGIQVQLFRYGVQVASFTPDVIPPAIVSYDVSLSDRTIDFYFDNVVRCSSAIVSDHITFYVMRFVNVLFSQTFRWNTLNFSINSGSVRQHCIILLHLRQADIVLMRIQRPSRLSSASRISRLLLDVDCPTYLRMTLF